MSMELMVKALKTKVGNPLRKLVLIKLADNSSDQGECWPSYQHIAEQCEISKRSVMSHIEALIEAGLVTKELRKGGPKGNSSNVYRLNLSGADFANPVVQHVHQGSAGDSLPSAGDSLGGSAGDSPRTSHSFESVKEPSLGSSSDEPFAYSAEFDEFWSSYPKRAGGNSKKGAFKAWNARLRSGVQAQDLIQSAKRYAEQMQAKGNVGTAYVKQAQTFLGPDEHWRDALASNIRQFPAGKNGRPPLGDGEFYHPDWESGTKIVCHVSTHDPDTGYTLEYMRKRGLI